MRYLVVVEQGSASFGAYVPDLPGCIAIGKTRNEVLAAIHEAIEYHLEGSKADGQPIPPPSSSSELVEVAARTALRADTDNGVASTLSVPSRASHLVRWASNQDGTGCA